MNIRNSGLGLALLTLAGCHGAPTRQQMSDADYGPYPTNYERIVHSYYNQTLKDPESAEFKSIDSPSAGYLGNRLVGGQYGYRTCVVLNAKNSYGAYVGYKTDALLIKNGVVISAFRDVAGQPGNDC